MIENVAEMTNIEMERSPVDIIVMVTDDVPSDDFLGWFTRSLDVLAHKEKQADLFHVLRAAASHEGRTSHR